MKKLTLFTLIGLCLLTLPVRAQINLLHEFVGGSSDGAHPEGSLILAGSTLYGMTLTGGSSGNGTIFKIETDGSGFTLLHEFSVGVSDGVNPVGSLLLSGSTLYGMTPLGGLGKGTIFKIETDGSGFALLHEFIGGAGDGKGPGKSLILSGSTLYGMTAYGGDSDFGTIFKIETDGNGFTLLHEFTGYPVDGANPEGSLLILGSNLYGMTGWGGDSDSGTIFKIDIDGNGFTLLHHFTGYPDDGDDPLGSLIISGSILFGMTKKGGANEAGTIFKIQTDGSDFALLHSFNNISGDDGCFPSEDLIISGSTLYGMTPLGGSNSGGTLFKIKADGTGFYLLHEFSEGTSIGYSPYGSLVISDSTLFGMTKWGGDSNFGTIFSLIVPSITVTSPNGGENWNSETSQNITWTSTGIIANVNINYSTNSGGSWTPIVAGTANDGLYPWTVPAITSTTCLIRICNALEPSVNDVSNAVFSILKSGDEAISTPTKPKGASTGEAYTTHAYATDSSISNWGDDVQYFFDWGDGTDSGWLNVGTTMAARVWAIGTYSVRAKARCATHTTVESLWSDSYEVFFYDGGSDNRRYHYNSPAQYKVVPEVIWAEAKGDGTWVTNVQITDVSGGSQVSVYYNTASGRRGPFLLWDNSAGAVLSSVKYNNLLLTIDGLDSGAFNYYGTVGAVEFITQDNSHRLQAAARTLNGNHSKTFPALSLNRDNIAFDLVYAYQDIVIPNLTNNSFYRSTCGLFNPNEDEVTVILGLYDASNNLIGSLFDKNLSGYDFTAFDPFNEAGVPYPANSHDNVILRITVASTGMVFCFGASANNATNDPAAHVAKQISTMSNNGPSRRQVLPEAIWAAATGGGTWMSEVQVTDVSGDSQVSVYYNTAAGRRGPFLLWNNGSGGASHSMKYSNILQEIGTIDSSFSYYGRVGTVEFQTQDTAHFIQVTARTLNGNYSKTFPGFNLVDAETADTGRTMLIQNFTNNSAYRSTCGFFNPTVDAVTVEFTLLDASGTQIGIPFSKTFVGYDYQAFLPFNEAGVPYPANSYDNVILRVRPTSGAGQVICFGASANNASNDPAAHLAVQGQ